MSFFAKGFARVLQPLVARQRFALQCMAVALLLATIAALGITGSAGWNANAAIGQPDIPATKPDNDTDFKTIAELLTKSPGDTAVVLMHVEEGARSLRKPEAQQRYDNFVNFMKFVNKQRVRVLAMASLPYGTTTVGTDYMLPTEVLNVLTDVTPAYEGFRPGRRSDPRINSTFNGKSLLENKLPGVRNIILIGPGKDNLTHVPAFEAVWNRVNVYRNANLDPRYDEATDTNFSSKFVDRMDHAKGFENATPLKLPTALALDKHLHYVPIGEIDDVLPTLPGANYDGSFAPDGTPFPHEFAPGTAARSSLGAFGDLQKYDAQIRLVLADNLQYLTRQQQARDPERFAFSIVPDATVRAFAQHTATLSDAQTIAAVKNKGIAQASSSVAFPDDRGEVALNTGLVELSIEAHGTVEGPLYNVAGLLPRQLGALIVAHPDLAVASALKNGGNPAIAHLHLSACGKRCSPDYLVGSGPDIEIDEIEYAKQLVRWLAGNGVDVDFVTVHNVMISGSGLTADGPLTWFLLRDAEGKARGWAFESRLLTTTLGYDPVNDKFIEDPDFHYLNKVEAVGETALPSSTHADGPRVPPPGGITPDWVADPVTPPIASPGWAQVSASGAVIDVRPAIGVPARLETSSKFDVDWAALAEVNGKPGTVVTAANLAAIAAGTRRDTGRIVVVDTDAARVEGVRLAVHLAGTSTDLTDWFDKLSANDLDTAGDDLVLMWAKRASQRWDTVPEMAADFLVVEAFNALKARAQSGSYSFHGADLTTRDGAAVVNAHLGSEPVVLIWLPSEHLYLARNAMLDPNASRAETLLRFRFNLALLMGPATMLWQQQGNAAMTWDSEQAYRDHFQLRGAAAIDTVVGANQGAVTAQVREDALADALHEGLQRDDANVGERETVQDVLQDRNEGRLHEWWSRARAALGSVADWIRTRFNALMQSLGLWEGDAAQTPAQSEAARVDDAAHTYFEGMQYGARFIRRSRVELVSRGLDPDRWMPVMGTVAPVETACAMSGCTSRPGETEYEMRWLHDTTGEELTLRTRDPVFADVRAFIDEHVVRANIEATGGHVSTMNAAFALMGLARILQAGKQLQEGGLPNNLATALQVQMYLGEGMAVAGVAKDVVQVVQLAREGMREAAQVTSALGATVKIEARLLRALGTSLDVVGGLASAGMVGVDIYSLLSAKTDAQRAVAGAQLAVDSTSLAVTAGAIVAEMAGAATASSILGAVAVPLAGVGIGIVGLVEAFMAVAQDVDAAAAKFDKFADLYPRTSWRADEDPLVATSHPDAPTMRRAYKWDDKSKVLQPVHGIAINKVDLRTRDSLGRRMNGFAESYIDRADPTRSGSQSYFGDRPSATGGNVPQGDRNAAPIPILARTGIYPTTHLPLANADVVETLIVPATPASRFHGYEYQNLPLANERHLKEAGFMGYEVLRRMEQWNDWNAGFFLFDFDLNAISMILRRVQEDWIPTTVDLVLDDDVHTIAWAEFVIPKDTKWSAAEQQAYRDSNRTMRGNMRYRLNPSGRTAPYVLALQDGYGSIELQAAATDKSTTWMLDARHLASPDAISVSVESRQSGGAAQFGVLRISGNEVRIAGVPGATTSAGEGTAEVYVVMAHGVWHVDFAKRELVSKDLLAATDLVHDKRVQDALKRKGFSWRSDGFIELTGSPTRTFPVNGRHVQRYYQSVRDETLVHAIEDFYSDATLVFGDASEALFHDPRGQLFRVPRGTVRPTRAYVIGDNVPHTIKRVDRLDAETLLVLVEYTRKQPANFTGAAAPDTSDGMTIAYRLGTQKAEVIALMGHNRLNAHLEEVDRATPNNVAYGDFMTYLTTLANVSYFPRALWLTPLVPVPAEWVSVNGQTRVNTLDVSRQYWIRAKDGHLLKPLVVKPSATCRAGTGAIDGFKVRQAVTSAGCAPAHPGDLVMLDAFQGPAAESGQATTTWRRFHSPSLGAVFGVRAHATDTTPVQYPRTQLMTVGKAGTAVEGEDANGLVWRRSANGWQLAGVGATYLATKPAAWFKDLLALVAAQPASTPAASPLPVTGLQDDDGASILAWHLPLSERWTLARPGMRLIDDGSRPPYRATVQDADGALWYSATVPTATFEKMLDGRKLRGKVQLDAVKTPSGLGLPVSLVSRRDAQCEGSMALYEDGTALCLSATGKPRVLEMAWCPSQASPVRPSGTEADYIQLACKADATHARSGWLAPNGERIALPKTDALADADEHRLLGFNAQARQAYFFHPGHQILYTTNWAGDLVRRNWVADARVAGDALVMQDSRYGLSPHHIPRIDGLTTLGLSSASHYATHHAIDAAIYLHYPRILIDMGGAPIGKHQRHQLSLLFTDASKLVVQAWPDGWRAHDPDMARQIELRGTGGNKWIYFGDTGKSLNLSTVRPVSFLELPKSGFTLPPAQAPFTDRLDVDGDNIADLLWVENVNGQGRMRWVLRNADGSVNGVQVRSDVAVPWTTDVASYHLFSSAGIALYCVRVTGAAPVVGRAGLNCHAIDRDGVRAAGHQTEAMIAAVPPDPVATAESARYLHLQRAPGEALGELVRFDGTDFQCVRDGTSQACLRTDSLAAANPAQTFLTCAATTPTAQAPAWCQRARASQQQATVIGPWVIHWGSALRLNQGDVECMSYDGRHCAWGSATPDYTRANPLTCGAMHRILWGEPGYGDPAHWCESERASLGDVTAVPPPTAGGKPSAENIRIEGDLRIGNTLRGNYTFAHPGGAREGASQHQWSLIDAVTGEVRPINGAKHRTYTLRPEDAGAQAIRFTIERLIASNGDMAPTMTSVTRSGITGNPPEARHLRIEGEAMLGKTLHAAFDPFDAENDPFGGTTYQWCEYPASSETADGCTPWGTSETYTLTFNSIGKRIGVKVIPRTTSGSPNVGVETLSPKTAVVTAPPPEARHVRIEGQAIAGATLRAAFDPFDALNRPFGGTTYQWCEYPATGNTPNGCAAWSTSETWIVTAGNVGKRLAVRVIPRVTTGTPNEGAQVESEKTGIVASGSAPQALNVRILGEPVRGLPLKAVFTTYDEHGDPFGGTTYQWCEYPTNSDTPNSCTAWSTSDTYTPTLANVGKRLAVKVIPRTTSGSPSEGPEATSPKTAAVAWAPPMYGRDHLLDIPDSGALVESKITVNDYGTITDHRVKVHITHPNIGDLEVYLVSPQGISQTLHKRTGGGEDNLIKEFKLATIGGEQRGVWTLRIRDAGTGFTGRLESWSMTFQGSAPAASPVPGPLDGAYHIRFVQMNLGTPADRGCMSAEGNGTGIVPSTNPTGPAALSCSVPAGSAKALWDVYPITSTTGKVAHVIRSRTNNRCLIRGNNGTASSASLYLWGTDPRFCGFPTADALIANGQAAWNLGGLQPIGAAGRAFHTGAARLEKPTQAFLVLTSGVGAFTNQASVLSMYTLEFHRAP